MHLKLWFNLPNLPEQSAIPFGLALPKQATEQAQMLLASSFFTDAPALLKLQANQQNRQGDFTSSICLLDALLTLGDYLHVECEGRRSLSQTHPAVP